MDPSFPREPLITTAEFAAELKISEQWVRDHAAGRRQPRIPAVRISGDVRPTYRFKLSEVMECLNNLTQTTATAKK
jgi:hypothetical protein